ncbi:unnamed protein product, partial [Oppiella nova]
MTKKFTAYFDKKGLHRRYGHYSTIVGTKYPWYTINLATDKLMDATNIVYGGYNLATYNCKYYAYNIFTLIRAMFSCTWKPNNWCGFYAKTRSTGKSPMVPFICRGEGDWRRGPVACSTICQYKNYVLEVDVTYGLMVVTDDRLFDFIGTHYTESDDKNSMIETLIT